MAVASLVREISEKSTGVVDFINYNNKVILCSENCGVKHISEDPLNSIDE
jgi:hypothetical protein